MLQRANATTGRAPVPEVFFYQIGMEFEIFCLRNGLDIKESTLYSYALCVASELNQREVDSEDEGDGTNLEDQLEALENPFTPQFVQDTVVAAGRWLVEMVICAQTGGLNERNIESLFKSHGSDKVPFKADSLIRYFAAKLPQLIEDAAAADFISQSLFTQYHTAASSTVGLVKKAMASAPSPGLFWNEDIVVLETAAADITSMALTRAIPDRMLVMSCAILKTCGGLPDIWYMGTKAVSLFPPSKYSALCSVIKRGHEIANDTGDLDTVRDLDVIVSKVANLMGMEDDSEPGIDLIP